MLRNIKASNGEQNRDGLGKEHSERESRKEALSSLIL